MKVGATVLEALHVRLASDLAGLTVTGDDRHAYGTDFDGLVTAAQVATQVETDELLRYRLERRLAEIEAVQLRLSDGTYGICESCGLPIAEERLEALPEAVHCFNCQCAYDRAHGRRGGARHAA
jgi:RNA polymerase-binding transcription factor DksA